jgi:hypothetical protein
LRARRGASFAAKLCPALSAPAAGLEARASRVLAGEAGTTGGFDVHRRAARALLAGRAAEALGLSRTLGGVEGLVLASRAAEAAGDGVEAHRLAARAYLAAGDPRPRLPDDGLFALAVSHPGLRVWGPSCLWSPTGEAGRPPAETLTPEGSLHASGTTAAVALRSVPGRVVVDRLEISAPAYVTCLSPEARHHLVHAEGPPRKRLLDRVDTLSFGDEGAPARPIRTPRQAYRLGELAPLLTAEGGAYLPDRLDQEGGRRWFRLAPGASSLTPLALPGDEAAPVLAGGALLAFEPAPAPDGSRVLARFDPVHGKPLGVVGRVPDGIRPALSPDGSRLFLLAGRDAFALVDLPSGVARRVSRRGDPLGLLDASHLLVRHEGRPWLHDLDKDTLAPAGPAAPVLDFVLTGELLLVDASDTLLALDLVGGGCVRAPGEFKAASSRGAPDPRFSVALEGGVLRLSRASGVAGASAPALRLRFARGHAGGMALDEQGRYELFGDVPPAFRAAASCGADLPLEVCADRWERSGLVAAFLRGDPPDPDP